MIFITFIIVTLYGLLITAFIIGFNKLKNEVIATKEAQSKFTVIIPFRNEATALPALLKSITALEYPTTHFELIFINDDSDDNSVENIQKHFEKLKITCSILENTRKTDSPKKDAIDTAIQQAQYDWIITTDADCNLPTNWLNAFDNLIQKKQSKLIVAPVSYNIRARFLEQFQLLDFLSLQGCTIGGFGIKKPFLSNGANLCYNKAAFFEVNGFEGNTNIASGDDMFLLEKMIQQYPDEVHYLKSQEAIVISQPQETFKELVQQRVRWASKATSYNNHFSKLVSIAVLLMNFWVLLLFIRSLISLNSWRLFLWVFLLKFVLDLILLTKATSFFKQSFVLKHYPLSSILYPVFTMFVVIASFNSSYTWKGRRFNK